MSSMHSNRIHCREPLIAFSRISFGFLWKIGTVAPAIPRNRVILHFAGACSRERKESSLIANPAVYLLGNSGYMALLKSA